jgi:hypothetical protein
VSRRRGLTGWRGVGRESRSDRAVSITVNYVIALSITAALVSGLLVGAGTYVENERDQVVREELTVVAEQLAAGIGDADRLARTAEDPTVRVGVDLPRRVAGESYRIEIVNLSAPEPQPERYELRLRSAGSGVSVTLTLSTLEAMNETSVNGGWVVVELDTGGTDALEVSDGDPSETLSLSRPGGTRI